MTFLKYAEGEPLPPAAKVGDIKLIPNGTKVKIDDIELERTGTNGSIVFGHAVSPDGATEFGWTSTRNLAGKFINEVLDEIPPAPGAGKFGPNAAWSGGEFIGQRTLVEIVDVKLEIERIALDTLDAYLALVKAGGCRQRPGRDQQRLSLLSGAEVSVRRLQEAPARLQQGGTSRHLKHQNGIAFDIRVAGGEGDPTYEWLKKNGPSHGFVRTVSGEPWHWEFDKTKANKAIAKHTFKTPNVSA